MRNDAAPNQRPAPISLRNPSIRCILSERWLLQRVVSRAGGLRHSQEKANPLRRRAWRRAIAWLSGTGRRWRPDAGCAGRTRRGEWNELEVPNAGEMQYATVNIRVIVAAPRVGYETPYL